MNKSPETKPDHRRESPTGTGCTKERFCKALSSPQSKARPLSWRLPVAHPRHKFTPCVAKIELGEAFFRKSQPRAVAGHEYPA